MKLEDQMKQLTDFMADLVPTVDRLAQNQELLIETTKQNSEAIHQMVGQVEKLAITSTKTNLEMSEMRLSNMRLAEAIEKLIIKIDKIDQFEERLSKLEKTVYK
jgi:ABC-type transporter Mla subunit MlaD